MDRIRAFPAGEFICEHCGRNNFFSLIAADVPNEVVEAMKHELTEEFGIRQIEGDFLLQPKTVKCRYCDYEYELDFQ